MIAARKRRRGSLKGTARRWTRRVDRRVDRLFLNAEPVVIRGAHRVRLAARRWSKRLLAWGKPVYARAGKLARWIGRRLRPVGIAVFRLLGFAERRARALGRATAGAATRASGVLTPERGICLVIVASAAYLLAAQFVDYRGVEVGQPGYAGLAAAEAPLVGVESPVDAHSYILVPVALLAAAIAIAVVRNGRQRLGRIVFALGLLSVAVILLIDMPAGLDAGAQASRFAGATAILTEGFYAQLAAAGGLMLGGLLLVLAPRTERVKTRKRRSVRGRKPRLARTQEGLARERTTGA